MSQATGLQLRDGGNGRGIDDSIRTLIRFDRSWTRRSHGAYKRSYTAMKLNRNYLEAFIAVY
jgi:hypothetical protein